MFKVNKKDTKTMPLAFRIFDSKRHHSISVHSKVCVSGKVGDVAEKIYKK